MEPSNKDFKIYQGSRWTAVVELKNVNTGEAVNLTDYTAKMQIRDINNDQLFIELTTENNKIVIDPLVGKVMLQLSSVDTAKLDQNGIYDLDLIDINGENYTYLRGKIILTKEITR